MARCAAAFFLVVSFAAIARADGWKAGVAKANITPQQYMWMSGYGGRDHPADGKLTDLWAKALVLEDAGGRRALLVTLDLVGIGRDISVPLCDRLKQEHGFDRHQVALCCSHTHTGPVVGRNLAAMYFFDDAQQKLVDDYTAQLIDNIMAAVGQALADVSSCELAWGQGKATFAVNRRNNPEAEVPALRERGELKGPVDHAVPVLQVTAPDGRLRAVVMGYACHSTVLAFFQWSGDYPGFAQLLLEQNHPGAIALFWAGCGADQNPLPRRTVEYAAEYGHRLAEVVETVLDSGLKPIDGDLATSYAEVPLPLDTLPTREQIVADSVSTDRYVAKRASILLAQIDGGAPLSQTYPYPVQAWRLGPDVLWITLGGEVVVDYALRLKSELGPKTWVAGYTNDVMAYIPSRRVLAEGGYEGGGAMTYYGLPTRWAPEVEETIVRQVHELAKATAAGSATAAP
jgi:neutral ceramidase